MNKRQKKTLIRIILSAIIVLTIELLNLDGGLRFWLYFIPYLTIGYDILIKAVKGILRGHVLAHCTCRVSAVNKARIRLRWGVERLGLPRAYLDNKWSGLP